MNWLYSLWYWITKPAGLVAWLGDGARHVSKDEAQRRANICMGCPNMASGRKVVETASMEIKRRLGLRVDGESSLSTCRSCGCFLPLKVWVPHDHIKQWQPQRTTDDIQKINPKCWQL